MSESRDGTNRENRHHASGARSLAAVLISAIVLTVGCGGAEEAPADPGLLDFAAAESDGGGEEELSPEERTAITAPWKGDFDGMVERRHIRALVVHNDLFYYLDGARARGLSYEALQEFEKFVNERLGTGTVKMHVLIIPVRRDQLLPAIAAGLGDIAVANLTITPERMETVAFSTPGAQGVDEVLVTGPSAPEVTSLDDLAGREIQVRRSSSYWGSLTKLNEEFAAAGKEPVKLVPADEYLEDGDLLEMVNAGLHPWAVVDSLKADLWAKVFDKLTVRHDIAFATGGEIGWAMRHDSPQLKEVVDDFIRGHKQGTLFGNILINRYLKDTKHVKNALSSHEMKKFERTVDFFRKYGGQYDVDYLLVAAQGYQESTLDQSKRSRAGAIGVMQLLKSTAADPNVGIPDIENIDSNIHAGVKYLDFIRRHYFADTGMDERNQALFSFAAYNAGPNRIARLRKEAEQMGLDPNLWFDNVEVVAAKRVGREPVQYVSNIYKYYVAYRQVVRLQEGRRAALEEASN
jgi:membrane-bound lytic murein transglycosylase MltF